MTLTKEWVFEEGKKLGLADYLDGRNEFYIELNVGNDEDYDESVYEELEALFDELWEVVPTGSKNSSVYFENGDKEHEFGYVSVEGQDKWDLDVASDLLSEMGNQGITSEEEAHNYITEVSYALEKLIYLVSDAISWKISEFEKRTGAEIL
ncbi:TPA: hypothetical protein ACGNDF_001517 [Streptococcus agalactiae]